MTRTSSRSQSHGRPPPRWGCARIYVACDARRRIRQPARGGFTPLTAGTTERTTSVRFGAPMSPLQLRTGSGVVGRRATWPARRPISMTCSRIASPCSSSSSVTVSGGTMRTAFGRTLLTIRPFASAAFVIRSPMSLVELHRPHQPLAAHCGDVRAAVERASCSRRSTILPFFATCAGMSLSMM